MKILKFTLAAALIVALFVFVVPTLAQDGITPDATLITAATLAAPLPDTSNTVVAPTPSTLDPNLVYAGIVVIAVFVCVGLSIVSVLITNPAVAALRDSAPPWVRELVADALDKVRQAAYDAVDGYVEETSSEIDDVALEEADRRIRELEGWLRAHNVPLPPASAG